MPQLIKESVSKDLLAKALLIREVEQRLLKLFVGRQTLRHRSHLHRAGVECHRDSGLSARGRL